MLTSSTQSLASSQSGSSIRRAPPIVSITAKAHCSAVSAIGIVGSAAEGAVEAVVAPPEGGGFVGQIEGLLGQEITHGSAVVRHAPLVVPPRSAVIARYASTPAVPQLRNVVPPAPLAIGIHGTFLAYLSKLELDFAEILGPAVP